MVLQILVSLLLIIFSFASPITEHDLIYGLEEDAFLTIQSLRDGSSYFVNMNTAKAKSSYINRILELDSTTNNITLNLEPFIIQTVI
jgi:hypothetical protein